MSERAKITASHLSRHKAARGELRRGLPVSRITQFDGLEGEPIEGRPW